jgi:hypothetical protein
VPEESPEEPITGDVDIPAGSETGTVTFVIPWDASTGSATGARSLAGAAGAIWQFRELLSTDTGKTLSVPIVRGHTYHFLFWVGMCLTRLSPRGLGMCTKKCTWSFSVPISINPIS